MVRYSSLEDFPFALQISLHFTMSQLAFGQQPITCLRNDSGIRQLCFRTEPCWWRVALTITMATVTFGAPSCTIRLARLGAQRGHCLTRAPGIRRLYSLRVKCWWLVAVTILP